MKEKALCLFALFIPLEQILLFVLGIDTELKPYRFFLLLAFCITILDKTFLKYKVRFELKGLFFIFIYGLIVGLIRIGTGDGGLAYLTNGAVHFFLGLITFYMFSNIKDTKLLNKIGNYFIIGIAISSFFGLYTFIFNPTSYFRLRGFFNNPNHLAIVINLITPFLIFNFITGRRKKIMLLLIIFFSMIVFLTASRTGVLLQLLNVLYLMVVAKRKILNFLVYGISIFFTYSFIVIPLLNKNNNILGRYAESNYKGAGGRFDLIDSAINLGVDTYFSGVGIQQYRFHHLTYAKSAENQALLDYKLGTHNHYLDLLINFGILPFIIYIIIMTRIVRMIYKIDSKNIRRAFYLFFMVFTVACSSQEMFMWPVFWACLSLLIIFNQKNINGNFNSSRS